MLKDARMCGCADVRMLPGPGTDSDHVLLVTKICIRLKKSLRFQKGKPRLHLENLHALRQEVQDTLGRNKICTIAYESWNVEVRWDNIKKCLLETE
jgi:hypothetical protein